MKLCTFEVKTILGIKKRIGMETPGGKILDLNFAYAFMLVKRDNHPKAIELADLLVPPDMLSFVQSEKFGIKAVDETLDFLKDRVEDNDLEGINGEKVVHNKKDIRLLAPILRPLSIRDNVGFLGHIRNAMGGQAIPQIYEEIPAIYYKGNPASVQGPDTDVIWPPFGENLDFELEFAAIIGRQGVDIPEDEAMGYIFGYTIFNDVSARTIQIKEMGGMLGPAKGKDMDGGNILGPYLVTADEFDPFDDHAMVARVNGEEWSRGKTSDMDYGFASIISYISQSETLYPGDLIGSGTVPTGCGQELGRFPKPGDEIEFEVDGLGILKNRYVNP